MSPSSPRPPSSPVTPTLPSCPSPSPYPQPPPSPTSYRPPSSSPSPCDTLSRSMQPPTCDPVLRDSPSLPLFSFSFFSKSHNVHNENHNVSIEPSSPILHPICNPNKLKMCLFNAQSVCKDGKADAIADFIHNGQVDIAFITETWLNSVGHEPIEKCLTPTDYRLASFPRPTLGGGIAILYKDSLHPLLSVSQSLPFSHSSFEHVQVCFQSTPHPITFSCVYRPPPSSTNKLTTRMFLSEFDQLLDHYSLLPGNLIVLGDINVHYDNPDSYDTKHICSSLSHHNMTQHISEPTQQAGHILDWIMSRQHANPATGNSLILSTSLTSALPSDHSAILCSVDISPPTRTKHTVTRRNLKSINLDTFSSDASRLLSEKSQNLTEHFDTTLRHLLDTHAPATTRHLPNRPPAPWLTPEIAHAKRARRRAERRWRKTKLTVHKQIFHTARRRVSTLISSAKNTYFQNKIITSSSSKQLFTTMNHLLGTQKTHLSQQHILMKNSQLFSPITSPPKYKLSAKISTQHHVSPAHLTHPSLVLPFALSHLSHRKNFLKQSDPCPSKPVNLILCPPPSTLTVYLLSCHSLLTSSTLHSNLGQSQILLSLPLSALSSRNTI